MPLHLIPNIHRDLALRPDYVAYAVQDGRELQVVFVDGKKLRLLLEPEDKLTLEKLASVTRVNWASGMGEFKTYPVNYDHASMHILLNLGKVIAITRARPNEDSVTGCALEVWFQQPMPHPLTLRFSSESKAQSVMASLCT